MSYQNVITYLDQLETFYKKAPGALAADALAAVRGFCEREINANSQNRTHVDVKDAKESVTSDEAGKILAWDRFKQMIDTHDLTYAYSDDHRVWERGNAQRAAIMAAAKMFDKAEVAKVWNAKVDRSVSEQYRAGFYWKV